MNAPIGVFDSGVGGLTVAREIMRQLPEESMIYFGDTARVPYGTKSKDTIVRYSRQIVNFLLSKGVKAVVIACNTASALALADLQDLYNVPIIGMGGIETAEDAIEMLLVGASAVSVGTANFYNPNVTMEIVDGIARYMEQNHFASVQDMVGIVK